MPDIREYPNLQELHEWLVSNFQALKEDLGRELDIPQQQLDRVEVEEVLIFGEHGRGTGRTGDFPLKAGFVINVHGEDTSDTDLFREVGGRVMEGFRTPDIYNNVREYEPPTETMMEWFDHIRVSAIPADGLDEGINRLAPVRESEEELMVYSLSRDQNLIVTREGFDRKPAGAQVSEGVSEGASTDESHIAHYPEIDSLLYKIKQSFNGAVDDVKGDYESQQDQIERLKIDSVVASGEWGSGKAEFGVDPLNLEVFVTLPGDKSPDSIPLFSRAAREIQEQMDDNFDPSDTIREWVGGFNFRVISKSNYEPTIESSIDEPDSDEAYDLVTRERLFLEPKETVGFRLESEEFKPLEQEIEFEVEEEVVVEEEEIVEEEPEEEITEEEKLEEKYPELPAELRPFAIGEGDEIDVPITKDSKKVPPRTIYEFEQELMTPGDAGTTIAREIEDGIGFYKKSGQFGDIVPPATFPRVGSYIKYHLLYQGPSYINEIYNDLVVYSAFLSSTYGGEYKVMTYESFREYIYRLKQLYERGLTPKLVEELSQQQAASRGLSTVPKLPSGVEAPWLERRKYLSVVEENIDHPAWHNPGEFLYEGE